MNSKKKSICELACQWSAKTPFTCSRWLSLALPLVLLLAIVSQGAEFTASTFGDYRIAAGVHVDDIEYIHALYSLESWSPIYVDGHMFNGELLYNLIYKKGDGVDRELWLNADWPGVSLYFGSDDELNSPLHIDAWTLPDGTERFAVIWTKPTGPERVLTHLRLNEGDPVQLPGYGAALPDAPTHGQMFDVLNEDGFKLVNRCLTYLLIDPPDDDVVEIDAGIRPWVTALYVKSPVSTTSQIHMSLDEFELVHDELEDNRPLKYVDVRDHFEIFSPVYKQDPREHHVSYKIWPDLIPAEHAAADANNMRPIAITGYQAFSDDDPVFDDNPAYIVIWMKDIGVVSGNVDPEGDLQPVPEHNDDPLPPQPPEPPQFPSYPGGLVYPLDPGWELFQLPNTGRSSQASKMTVRGFGQ